LTPKRTVTIPIHRAKPSDNTDTDEDEDKVSSSSDESQDDTNSDEEDVNISVPSTSLKPGHRESPPQRDSPSPPANVDIPLSFLQTRPRASKLSHKFWMASIAKGFKDDLEEIRKEPNLGPSRLALLIESFASGADVFSSNSAGSSVNEMETVLDQLPVQFFTRS
ncbi:hypothetical protein EV363DRAFT_1152642, partial [Boletus edulis]